MPDGTAPDAFSTLDSAAIGGHPFPAQLLLWLSPAFPVGGFAFSHGLEWAAERGWVKDRATLEAWIVDLVTLGSVANDLVLLAAAWRAATARYWDGNAGRRRCGAWMTAPARPVRGRARPRI